MSRGRVAVLAVRVPSLAEGGAERLYEGLRDALLDAGAEAELVSFVSRDDDLESLLASYLACYDLDLLEFDGVVSTKVPSYAVRHPNHVCYLLHTHRTLYDMFEATHPRPWDRLLEVRRQAIEIDTAALSPPATRELFCIGHQVRRRLTEFTGLEAEVLHPDTPLENLHAGDYRYVFLPGRLHPWKRVDLVLRAMRLVDRDVDLLISGRGEPEHEARYRDLAAGDPRIRFLGHLSDEELAATYADALVVPFVPVGEDFGYVTLEAFRAAVPVITCSDSGEPAVIVEDGVHGFVCDPRPAPIAAAIERLVDRPRLARRMGERGRELAQRFDMAHTAETLLSALGM